MIKMFKRNNGRYAFAYLPQSVEKVKQKCLVIYWACINMRDPIVGPQWKLLDTGETFTWISNEHWHHRWCEYSGQKWCGLRPLHPQQSTVRLFQGGIHKGQDVYKRQLLGCSDILGVPDKPSCSGIHPHLCAHGKSPGFLPVMWSTLYLAVIPLGVLIGGLAYDEGDITETESSIELNLYALKMKRTVKRTKKG